MLTNSCLKKKESQLMKEKNQLQKTSHGEKLSKIPAIQQFLLLEQEFTSQKMVMKAIIQTLSIQDLNKRIGKINLILSLKMMRVIHIQQNHLRDQESISQKMVIRITTQTLKVHV
jgi:hypothetical protein